MRHAAAGIVLLLGLTASTVEAQADRGSGFVTGYFSTADPACNPCSGLGTNVFTWGTAAAGSFPSSLSFLGLQFFNVGHGEPFIAGQLGFRNGANFGTLPSYVNLVINTHSPNPAFDHTQQFRINIVGTPNTADPLASSDYVYFNEAPNFGTFRVFENASTVVDVKGSINSFHFEGFGRVADPSVGFVTATTARADLTPVPGTGPAVVPEPGSSLLFGTGFAAVAAACAARRRRLTHVS